jgi:hypothetical protein
LSRRDAARRLTRQDRRAAEDNAQNEQQRHNLGMETDLMISTAKFDAHALTVRLI